MKKEIIRCWKCGRKLEVYVEGNEIVDVGEVLNEGVLGCQHEYE